MTAAPFFSALESGRPDSWKIRSTLFWALLFQIRAILKDQGDPQKQLKSKLRANKKLKNSAFFKLLTDLKFKFSKNQVDLNPGQPKSRLT